VKINMNIKVFILFHIFSINFKQELMQDSNKSLNNKLKNKMIRLFKKCHMQNNTEKNDLNE